jgi:putative ABC transport system permease protein
MGIPLIRGRDFTDQDRDPAPTPVIVNAALAKRYWPGEDPIGKRLRFGDSDDDWMTVVAIVGDSRHQSLDAEPSPLLYLPFDRLALPFMSIAARSSAGPGVVSSLVREVVRQADPDLPIDRIVPLRQVLSESVAQPRFRTLLIGGFALLATVLAAVGVYGLVSYSVTQRTREIGIRIALGARPEQVMRPVLREGLLLGAAGIALGLAGAAAATRLLASFLFDVEPFDPITFAAVALLLLAITLLASYVPSRRALRVDPITALRAE